MLPQKPWRRQLRRVFGGGMRDSLIMRAFPRIGESERGWTAGISVPMAIDPSGGLRAPELPPSHGSRLSCAARRLFSTSQSFHQIQRSIDGWRERAGGSNLALVMRPRGPTAQQAWKDVQSTAQ